MKPETARHIAEMQYKYLVKIAPEIKTIGREQVIKELMSMRWSNRLKQLYLQRDEAINNN